MAAPRSERTRNGMIHCPYCGEDYAASYKRCPFCDERPLDETSDYAYGEDEAGLSKGGKRLINTRGGGYGGSPSPLKIVGTVLSLAVIVAAVIIVISVLKPLVDKGHTTLGSPPPQNPQMNSPAPGDNVSPPPDASPEASDPSLEASDPSSEDPSDPAGAPEAETPATQTATGFTINRSDFTLDKAGDYWDLNPTFTPAGTTGTITWVSDKPEVATVNEYGLVTAVSRGTANITATMAGGFSQSCIVRCNFTDTSSAGSSNTTTQPSGPLSLNHTDFTFSSLSDTPVTMRVSGTSSTPSWSIGNTGVATISADGVVRPVGKGNTTITCTVDGQTLTCIVRCNF